MTTEVANSPSHGIYHYIWGGAFICLLIVINHIGMTLLINAQQRHIALSKLSSQQRILFQETGRMAHDIMTELGQDEPNLYLIENLQHDLKTSVDELYTTYKSIIALADKNVVPFLSQTDVHAYYFEEPYALDRRMNSFFARINVFATQDPTSLKRRFQRWTSVDIAIAKNGLLVKGFDELMPRSPELRRLPRHVQPSCPHPDHHAADSERPGYPDHCRGSAFHIQTAD